MPEARNVHPRLVGMLISTLLLIMPKRSSAFASASMGVLRRGLTSSGRPRLRAASSCADDQPLRRSSAAAWLLSGVKEIHGIGPKNVEYLKKLQIATVMDLLLHFPVSVVDWGRIACLRYVKEGDVVTLQLRVKKHSPPLGRMPLVIHCEDGEGQAIDLLFFVQSHTWQHVARVYDVGSVKIVRGRIGPRRYGKASFSMAGPETYRDRASPVEPVYKLTAGIKPTKLRDQILAALERMPAVDDWLDEELRRRKGWPRFDEALRLLHNPRSEDDLHPLAKASERLAFDELLATQIPLVMRKLRKVDPDGEEGVVRPIVGDGHLTQRCIERLPYELTQSQREAVEAIWKDLESPYQRMNRLLQGDVGSGKTVCALLAMLRAVEGGGQAALLAPTEILVNQHYETLQQLCEGLMVRRPRESVAEGDEAISSSPSPAAADAASEEVVVDGGMDVISSSDGNATAVQGERPLRIEVLTGALKGKARKVLLEDLRNGDIDILVGTHALFSESTVFKDLALTVIDEEQRWGVNQREKLSKDTHVLSMSATPIARTFLLTLYGNYDVSRLTCRPHGEEVEVTTSVMALTKADETISGLRRLLFTDAPSADKEKVFWVLPCVGNEGSRSSAASTDAVVMSVLKRFEILVEAFGEEHVRMMHGRMDPESKRKAIKDFSEGTACVLVATSVVEVGVDVPDASVIIVERADRFGLLQLHQLRGRIGRPRPVRDRGKEGKRKCHCLLLYDPTSSSPDKDKERLERLTQLKKTTDGFEIAELDYKLRGPGEVLGSRQSGFKGFKLVDLARHSELLEEAHALAHTHARQLQDICDSSSSTVSHSLDQLLTLFKNPDTLIVEKTRCERRVSTSTSIARRSKLLLSGASASAGSTIGSITTTVSEEAVRSLTGAVVAEGEARKDATIVTEVDSTISYSPAESVELSRQSIGLRSGGSVEIARPLATKKEEEEIEVEVVGVGSNAVAVPTVKWEVDLVAMRNELVFVLFDTETTGVGNTDGIIQIAAKVIDDATVDGYQRQVPYTGPLSFSEYVYPRQRISAGAIQVTGITHEFLAKQGAQPFERVWPRFAQWLNSVRGERGVVLIAHQACFDMRMLMQDFREINLDGTALREDAGVVAVLDTLTLLRAKELWPQDVQPPPRHRLGVVYEHLMGQPLQQAHCAMHDVLGLEAILLHPYIRTNWMRIAGKKCLSRVVPIASTERAETKATRTRRQSPLATARSTLSM